MAWHDNLFKMIIKTVLDTGVWSKNPRPRYKDGTEANSKYITQLVMEYDLVKGQYPLTQLRPIPWKSAIKEVMWIYQDQTSNLSVLRDKYGVNYWDEWDIGDGTIGARYGETVSAYDIMNKLLKGLEENPWNRRNIINLWQYDQFEETEGLKPCAFQTMFDVRDVDGVIYLDCTLIQRSSDMLVALHINQIQYVALQMMIACHFGWEVGKFMHVIQNAHIYDNQFENAQKLLDRNVPKTAPKLRLTCDKGTNFYDIKPEDFIIEEYEPVKPQLKFDLAI